MLAVRRNTAEDIWPNESRKERKVKYLCVDGNNLLERAHSSVGGERPLENTA